MCSCAAALTLGFGVLMDPMVLAVLYVWCMLNKEVIVSFWFGTQFKVRRSFFKLRLVVSHFVKKLKLIK